MDRIPLVQGLLCRDERAWRQFIRDYSGLIYAVATEFHLKGADRDDLFQNTCLAAVRAIDTLRDPSMLSLWIYRIARNRAIDALRRRRPEVSLEQLDGAARSSAAMQENPSIVDELERLEDVARLRDALDRLDDRCRRLVRILYLTDPRPSYADVACREKMPMGSIGPTRARCLKKMRRLLKSLSGG
ncbi:MAG: sigma-70 family RNA polymerase sigma factor [Candidatus Eisenbacteria sp.]|nr:sigma-70 family RNA polymerase sigma factor [Candidatus Eisenbacteria bacterium]